MPKISKQVQRLIRRSRFGAYAICKTTGIDQPSMSRFLVHKAGLSTERRDQISELPNLQVVKAKSKGR